MLRPTNSPREKRNINKPYRGWSWRGGILQDEEIAVYERGALLKHLGQSRTRLGEVYDFPILFFVWANSASLPSQNPNEVTFPSDSKFWVREVVNSNDRRTCICLEQDAPDAEPYMGIALEFLPWAANLPDTLPQPPVDLVLAWCSPFACWDPMANEGDGPRRAEEWNYVEATHFISNFTGLNERVVNRVLEAHEDFLELIGLIPATQGGSILEEREAMKALLPGDRGTINAAQELAYLQLVTGLAEHTIQLVCNGEAAYCLRIGLPDPPS